jgi:Ni/Fe-hydrogenase subunit HybB-like protein
MSRRLLVLKSVLWALVGTLAAVTVARFVHGLGAVSNLSDTAPWGLWIGFDVMGGVALAAGGFVVAAAVYIFGLEAYRPFVRPAILTAFLGYVAVAVGLLYDLGLPWHIWHPMVYWQYHSVLFEVAACVMLYLTVLALEFAPVVLEHPRLDRPWLRRLLHGLRRVTIPLVIAGITLSTLHQSSLGSLFLITPYRLHPLWYSPIMYVLFLLSAVGLGLMTVVLESVLAAVFLNHHVHQARLAGLGKAGAAVLLGYVALRVGDLAVRGVFGAAFGTSWHTNLFVLELLVSAVAPAALLLIPRVRRSLGGMALCAALTVAGMVGYRLNVSIVAFARPERFGYFPSWMEFAVSLGIVAGAALVFIFFVERFRVYEEGPVTPAPPRRSYDPATLHGLLPVRLAAPRRFSLIAVAAASVTVLLLPREATLGVRPAAIPARAARTVDGYATERIGGRRRLVLARREGNGPAIPVLLIDGNRNGDATLLDHQGHVDRLGGDTACGRCHHIDLPFDREAACVACHRDMYEPTVVFAHASHIAALGGNDGCAKCHAAGVTPKSCETATPCAECHADLLAAGAFLAAPEDRWAAAAGYVEAMHGLCRDCHTRERARQPERYPATLDRCDTCHDADRPAELRDRAPGLRRQRTATRGAGAGRSKPSGEGAAEAAARPAAEAAQGEGT